MKKYVPLPLAAIEVGPGIRLTMTGPPLFIFHLGRTLSRQRDHRRLKRRREQGHPRISPLSYSDEHIDEDDVPPPAAWVLCYLTCLPDPSGGYVGAILLTDNRARPIHFAYVQPVKPSKMQKILYGSTLDQHVKIDVIAQKLWQGLAQSPDVVFVDFADLVAVKRITGKVPVAFLAKNSPASGDSQTLSTVRYDAGT